MFDYCWAGVVQQWDVGHHAAAPLTHRPTGYALFPAIPFSACRCIRYKYIHVQTISQTQTRKFKYKYLVFIAGGTSQVCKC